MARRDTRRRRHVRHCDSGTRSTRPRPGRRRANPSGCGPRPGDPERSGTRSARTRCRACSRRTAGRCAWRRASCWPPRCSPRASAIRFRSPRPSPLPPFPTCLPRGRRRRRRRGGLATGTRFRLPVAGVVPLFLSGGRRSAPGAVCGYCPATVARATFRRRTRLSRMPLVFRIPSGAAGGNPLTCGWFGGSGDPDIVPARVVPPGVAHDAGLCEAAPELVRAFAFDPENTVYLPRTVAALRRYLADVGGPSGSPPPTSAGTWRCSSASGAATACRLPRTRLVPSRPSCAPARFPD